MVLMSVGKMARRVQTPYKGIIQNYGGVKAAQGKATI